MGHDGEAMGRRHRRLPVFDDGIVELEDVAAVATDEVVVVIVALGHRLVAGLPVVEVALVGDARFDEELHRPVDGGVANPGHVALHPLQQLLDGDMIGGAGEDAQDHVALPRRLQALLLDVALQALLQDGEIRHFPAPKTT